MPSFRSLYDSTEDKIDTPVIGIVAQPWVTAIKDSNGETCDYKQMDFFPFRHYIAASYVKWIEQAGGRVVPVPASASREELEELMSQLNGILLPGGDGAYPECIQLILQIAINFNENGHFFPIFGTCLGFQYLATHYAVRYNGWRPEYAESSPLPSPPLVAPPATPQEQPKKTNFHFLGNFPVHNQSNPLHFTPEASESQWYTDLPDNIRNAYASENITANFHNYGVSVENFDRFLKNDFILVSTAHADVTITAEQRNQVVLRMGDEIIQHPTQEGSFIWKKHHVTHMEHRKYPIFGVQYHPERTVFEWGINSTGAQSQNILRSRNAILASQFSATWFVFLCRKSCHVFHDLRVMHSKLIYHYQKEAFGTGIVEMYIFNNFIRTVPIELDHSNDDIFIVKNENYDNFDNFQNLIQNQKNHQNHQNHQNADPNHSNSKSSSPTVTTSLLPQRERIILPLRWINGVKVQNENNNQIQPKRRCSFDEPLIAPQSTHIQSESLILPM